MKDGEPGDVGHGEEGGAGDGKEPQGLQHTIQASGFLSTKTAQCSHVMSANFWEFTTFLVCNCHYSSDSNNDAISWVK